MQSSSSTTRERQVQAFLDDPMLGDHLERIEAWVHLRWGQGGSGRARFISETEDFLSTRTQDCHPFWVGAAYLRLLEALCYHDDLDLVQPDRLRAVVMEVQCQLESMIDFTESLSDGIDKDKKDPVIWQGYNRDVILWDLIEDVTDAKCEIRIAEQTIKAAETRAKDKANDDAVAAVQSRMVTHNIQEDEEMEDMQWGKSEGPADARDRG